MLKGLGCALLLAATLLLRGGILAEKRARRTALRELSAALSALARGIRLTLTPLPRLLSTIPCEGAARDFFSLVTAALARGETLSQSWDRASRALPLPTREGELLRALAPALSGDAESVCAALTLTARELSEAERLLAQRQREDERLATALCLGGGLLVSILLL